MNVSSSSPWLLRSDCTRRKTRMIFVKSAIKRVWIKNIICVKILIVVTFSSKVEVFCERWHK